MAKTTQTAQTIALIINGIKNSINNFTLEELTKLLKQNKCPYSNRITTILLSHNLINKDNKNRYNFITTSPIYYSYFETGLNQIKISQSNYNKKYKHNKKVNDNLSEIDKAIILLKNNGFKIFKEI